MKEKVDRILDGEAVDIAEDDADYYLSVLINAGAHIVSFEEPDWVKRLNQALRDEGLV